MQNNEDDKVIADPSRHSISKSIALHLLPGFVITVIYVAVAPLAIRYGMPLFLVIFLLALFLLIPFELGLLLYLGRKRNGSFSLDGIASYRERMPLRQYFVFAVILLVWVFVAAAVLFRPMEKPIIDRFFSWVPPIFLLENFMEHLEEYNRTFLLVTALMGVLLNGFVGPIVEELYFRGYLLPRSPRSTGAWAPLLNSSLFSLYHFFTPWQIPLRILAFTPLFYAVWWKRNVYLGMIVHCAANLTGMSMMLIAILKAL
jgi:membrane protease YdiL (CAAX protease family)